jgi:hypothetical protein
MSNSQKGNTNKRGKSLTEETKLKISKTLKNRSKTK